MSCAIGAYPDDLLAGEIANVDQKEKRKAEIHKWFSDFQSFCQTEGEFYTEYDHDLVDQINQNYWEEMCESVRARLVPQVGKEIRADRHKIASLFELLITHFQPFQCDDEDCKIDLNARAAFFVATNIIGNWGRVNTDDLYVSESFDREHRTWLKQLNVHAEGSPIFSNAATWYLVERIFIERSEYRNRH
jgi:hypothetical protein